MNKLITASRLLLIILGLEIYCTACLSQQNKPQPFPLLKRPASVSEEVWVKEWTDKVTVNAGLSIDDHYIYPDHYPEFVVRLSIKNRTGHKLATGSNLYLVETATQSQANKPTTDLFEVIGGYFKQPPLEDYAGIVETRGEPLSDNISMGLVDWVTTENRGGFYSTLGALLHIAGYRSKNPTAQNFGTAQPGDSLVIESEDLQLSIKVKSDKLSDIFIVSPLLKFGVNGEAQFRYILRFENGKKLSETVLIPMSASSLKQIAENNSEPLWKRVFAVSWSGDHLGQDAGQLLTTALQDRSAALRKAALNGIASAKYVPAFADVLKIAQDQNIHPSLMGTAIRTLGKLADNRSASFLLSVVADKKSAFREDALDALSNLNDPSVQEPVLKLLETGNLPSERVLLPKFDTSFIGRLQTAATDRKANKQAAMRAIAKMNTTHAVEVLAQLYRQSDVKVHSQICNALEGINGPGAESILIMALQEKDPSVQSSALNSLASVRSPSRNKILIDQLSSPDPQMVMVAIRRVSEARIEEAKPQILRLLNDPSQKADIRRSAAGSLVYYPNNESIKALIAVLTDPVKDVRIESAQTLALIPGKEQVPALTRSLNDSEMLVRLYSARAITKLNGQLSCQPILGALLNEQDGECAETMANCLIQISCKDPRQAAPLISRINSNDERVRAAVGRYLSFASNKTFETGYNASAATLNEAVKAWTEWAKGNK